MKYDIFKKKEAPAPAPRPQRPKETPLFDQLFPCSFRGIQFPVTRMGVALSHDHIEHKYYNVNAANVESTGLNSLMFDAEIPLVNGIAPGKNERWGVLYPDVFRLLLRAFMSKEPGYLDTPEISGFVVKPVSFDYKHEGTIRDGVIVSAKWIETLDLRMQPNVSLSNLEAARIAALNLDAELQGTPQALPDNSKSFEQLVNELTGVFDTSLSRLKILANKPGQILYRLQKVQDSLERAKDPKTWFARESLERAEELVRGVKDVPGQVNDIITGKRIARYTTAHRTTLSQLASALSNSVDELLRLNPNLAAAPRIAPNTTVRYYASGTASIQRPL